MHGLSHGPDPAGNFLGLMSDLTSMFLMFFALLCMTVNLDSVIHCRSVALCKMCRLALIILLIG